MANDTWRKEQNYKIKKRSGHSEKGKLKVLEYIASGYHHTSRDEGKINEGYLSITRNQLETKLYSRNLIKEISRTNLKMDKDGTQTNGPMDKKIHIGVYTLHLTFLSITEGGRELASIQDCVFTSIQRLED